ncbi:MAG: ribbon-helix-helix protein, CopG family [Thermoleophilaceae bacterium]
MRTTVRLDDDLLREAKALAARRGRTLTSLIEDGLREQLLRAEESPLRGEIELPTWSGGQLRPGVDLDDSAATRDLLDEEDEDRAR